MCSFTVWSLRKFCHQLCCEHTLPCDWFLQPLTSSLLNTDSRVSLLRNNSYCLFLSKVCMKYLPLGIKQATNNLIWFYCAVVLLSDRHKPTILFCNVTYFHLFISLYNCSLMHLKNLFFAYRLFLKFLLKKNRNEIDLQQ